jgi:hypothetical protein
MVATYLTYFVPSFFTTKNFNIWLRFSKVKEFRYKLPIFFYQVSLAPVLGLGKSGFFMVAKIRRA